jgi:hypothetical protein
MGASALIRHGSTAESLVVIASPSPVRLILAYAAVAGQSGTAEEVLRSPIDLVGLRRDWASQTPNLHLLSSIPIFIRSGGA